MEDEKARLEAGLEKLAYGELWRRSCIALYGATGDTAYRERVLDHMDESSGMSLLFAWGETGNEAYRQEMEKLAQRIPMDAAPGGLYQYQPFHAAWDVRFGGRQDARAIVRLFQSAFDQRSNARYRLALADCLEQMDIQLYEHYRALADLLLKTAQETLAAPALNAADCYMLMKGVRLDLLDPERYLPRAAESFAKGCLDAYYPLAWSEHRRMKA